MFYAAGLIEWFALFAFLVALVAAALSDAATYIIPNRYAAAVVAAFPIYTIGKPFDLWLSGLAAATLLLVSGGFLFARGLLGGGDVKLLTAIGLWAGFDQLALLLFATAMAGGALALAYLSPLYRLLPARSGGSSVDLHDEPRSRLREPIPFGIAIAFGGICVALSHTAYLE